VGASLCSIDVVGRGQGVLQAVGGTRAVASALAGRVATVHVSSGAIVRAGDQLVSIDATDLQSRLVQSRQQTRAAQKQLERLRGPDDLLFKREIAQLEQQLELLQQRVRSQRQSADELQVRLGNVGELSSRGYVAEVDVRELGERSRELDRVRLGLEQQISETRLSVVTATRQHDAQLQTARAQRDEAEAEERALALLIEQTRIVAPDDGLVEAIVVKPGELIPNGAVVARIVPPQLPTQVVAFFPDRDRAFLQAGSAVRLEVAQLPSSEFGTLRGHVTGVASSFASTEELLAIFGAHVPAIEASYRTDIVLDDDLRTRSLVSKLRAGTQLSARAALRERRIITLLFDPLRRYLE
jgi:multidrug resistance efflux pump